MKGRVLAGALVVTTAMLFGGCATGRWGEAPSVSLHPDSIRCPRVTVELGAETYQSMNDLDHVIRVHDEDHIYGAVNPTGQFGPEYASVILLRAGQETSGPAPLSYPRSQWFRKNDLDVIDQDGVVIGPDARSASTSRDGSVYVLPPGTYVIEVRYRGSECEETWCDFACTARSVPFRVIEPWTFAVDK